jgi:twitching motility protein PilT
MRWEAATLRTDVGEVKLDHGIGVTAELAVRRRTGPAVGCARVSRELIQTIRAASWRTAAEASALFASADVGAAEIMQVLELLQNKALAMDERHAMRRQAFVVLVQRFGDESLFRPLVRALRGAAPDVRAAILDLLPRLVGENDPAELVELLQAPEVETRTAGARVFGEPAIVRRAPALVMRALGQACRDPVEAVAVAALTSLGQVAPEAEYLSVALPIIEGKNLRAAVVALEGLRRFPNERTAALLERKLASGPQALRFAALGVVEAAGADALVGVAVRGLAHPHLAVRNRATEVMSALARGGRVEVGRTIVWLLRSADVSLRRMAAEVLRSVPDPHGELWPKLVSSLRDDDWWVRERVMDALVDLAGRGLSRYMVAWLADPSDVVRRFALSVLLRLKDPETIGALVHCAANDSDWWAREKAIEVIAEFKDPRAVPTIVDIMQRSPELQLACILALKHIDAATAAPHVLPLAHANDADVRLAVLQVIEELNDATHAGIAEELCEDPDPAVQRQARAVLARFSVVLDADPGVPALAPVVVGDTTPLDALLLRVVETGGDDLILAADRPAFMKRHGGVEPVTAAAVGAERVAALLTPLLTAALTTRFEQKKDVDFSYVVKSNGARFRVNLFRQRGGLSAVFHAVRGTVPHLDQLGLPPLVASWCNFKNGLVLIAGPTNAGKSTTLAALLDAMNRTSALHIVSIEDPIEVQHTPKVSLVNQREVGTHTRSFAAALRSALREDPDVLMIGELRDAETIALALTAAETGHLVFGTLNTISSDQAVERIINAFPRRQQEQVRSGLADVLRAIVCQTLVRGRDGQSRHLAAEVLINNEAVANLIRRGKSMQIPSIVATAAEVGMQTLEQDLARLIKSGLVDPDDASAKVRNKRDLEAARTSAQAAVEATPVVARKVFT